MKCDKIRKMFADDWAGTLNSSERAQFETHLAKCSLCRKERESLDALWIMLGTIPRAKPGPALRRRFDAMLAGYRQGIEPLGTERLQRLGLTGWLTPVCRFQPAVRLMLIVVLLGIGFALGYVVRSVHNGHEEIANLRSEVKEMRQMVTISLLKQQSASERLKGVSWSSQVSQPDPEFLSALVQTLNYDPSVDVRLAAVDALARFTDYPAVRQDLVKSLARQKSPLVQISLIDLLVQIHERQSVDVLRQIIDDANQNLEVRNRAQWGLKMLT